MVKFWGKRKRPKLLQKLFWRWIFIWTSLFSIFPNCGQSIRLIHSPSRNSLPATKISPDSLTTPNISSDSLTATNMSRSLLPNFNTSMNSLPTSSVSPNGLTASTMNVSGLGSVDSFSYDDSTNSRTNRSANLLKNSSKVFSDLIFQPDHLFTGNSETTTQADILEESPASDNPISCIGRCGDNLSFPCSCTDVCVVNGNCCPDMANHCHSSFESGSSRFRHLLDAIVECSSMTSTFMVVSCPNHPNSKADKVVKANSLAKEDMADRTVLSNSMLKRSGSPTLSTLPSLTGPPNKSSSNSSEPVQELIRGGRKFKLSLVASLSTSGALSVRAASGKSQLSWTSIECSVSAENHGGGNCKRTKCIQNFEERPDGICRTAIMSRFAVSEGDCIYRRSKETDRKILSMIKCYLESYINAELDAETVRVDTVYDTRLGLLFVQVSALVYYPYNPDQLSQYKMFTELPLIIYDANICCEPQPLPTVCTDDSCLYGDLEVSLVKTMDIFRRSANELSEREKSVVVTKDSVTVCNSNLVQRVWSMDTRGIFYYCMHEPIYASQLDILRRAANVSCFGGDVGNRVFYGQKRRMCSNSYSRRSIIGLWLTIFVLFMVLLHI
ncbi:hypothetical protein ElyMa_005022200 [Elysia marginata]|uniref:SMB domain-containing protein n=1 Tax=Elysia marginata TaxID=1093978 RepID=A0AAV4J8D5_9GAST|nr:hypothetical protein ElyMa_005022200 [Elysia marginata]